MGVGAASGSTCVSAISRARFVLVLYINHEYAKAVDDLRAKDRQTKADTDNRFFRALQIIENVRRS